MIHNQEKMLEALRSMPTPEDCLRTNSHTLQFAFIRVAVTVLAYGLANIATAIREGQHQS